MKRIIICCDGTWNLPDETAADRQPCPTNVVKLAEAISDGSGDTRQLVFYHPGIGSSGSWLKRVYDGATGTGISANILQAYIYLIQQFEPGDDLYLFGFSRGAFTVRSLSGLIRSCGILRRDAMNVLPRAYALYRSRRPATHPRAREATLFRRTYAVQDITPISLIAVWDTVGALGNPLLFRSLSPGNRFHDTDLSRHVRLAYQALAIDEARRNFSPTLWHQQPDAEGQVLEQRWFVGSHSNVGGGYADAGLSDTALAWLASKARDAGLVLGTLPLSPNPMAPLVNSRTGLYRLVPTVHRRMGFQSAAGATRESLDDSVMLRYQQDKRYRPPNLVDYLWRYPAVLG